MGIRQKTSQMQFQSFPSDIIACLRSQIIHRVHFTRHSTTSLLSSLCLLFYSPFPIQGMEKGGAAVANGWMEVDAPHSSAAWGNSLNCPHGWACPANNHLSQPWDIGNGNTKIKWLWACADYRIPLAKQLYLHPLLTGQEAIFQVVFLFYLAGEE